MNKCIKERNHSVASFPRLTSVVSACVVAVQSLGEHEVPTVPFRANGRRVVVRSPLGADVNVVGYRCAQAGDQK